MKLHPSVAVLSAALAAFALAGCQAKDEAPAASEDGGTAGSPGQEKVTIQVAAQGNDLEVT